MVFSWALSLVAACLWHKFAWDADLQVSGEHFARAFLLVMSDASNASVLDANFALTPAALLVNDVSQWVYQLVFVKTGIEREFFMAIHGAQSDGLDQTMFDFMVSQRGYLEACMWATKLWGAKFALLLTTLPLFLAAYLVALVDGLVLRYIRREGGGRESAFIYHRSKYMSVMLLGSAMSALLLLPLEFEPRWVFPPLALCVGFMARIQWQYYKKYIYSPGN